jgi:hypothetical protein
VVQSFGSHNGFVIGVASCAEKLTSMRGFAGFPISFKTVACRFQSLECRSEPWAGFDRSDERMSFFCRGACLSRMVRRVKL